MSGSKAAPTVLVIELATLPPAQPCILERTALVCWSITFLISVSAAELEKDSDILPPSSTRNDTQAAPSCISALK